ncbi:MAG TPA: GNVR domain-containing protein [Candidatus Acidoferrales bacterium]|nr:GNVR domain-containing protein [Candidatus Acidoferrales bacterium]
MVGHRDLTLEDCISILRRRWPLIVVLTVVGSALGYGLARSLPKRFTSQTLVLVEQPTVPGDYVKPVVSEDTNQRLASMQQEILSRAHIEPLIRQFGLYRQDINRVPMEDLVDRLRSSVTVAPIQPMAQTQSQGLAGFTISVNFQDPQIAQQICSTVTSLFMEENLRLHQDQAEQTTQFLAKQLDEAKAKLDDQDAKLADFKRRYLGSLPDQERENVDILMGLTSQLDATTQALSRSQQDKSFAESMLTQQLAAWQAASNGQNPETLDQQYSALQEQLTVLKSKYTSDHPDVMKATKDLEALKKKMAEADAEDPALATSRPGKKPAEPSQIQSLRAQIRQYDQVIQDRTTQQEELQQQIKTFQSRVQSSPAIEQGYKQLTRDYQTALDFYNELLKKRDQSAMATDLERRQQGEQFRVLDPANLPDHPSFPKVSVFVLGGFGGGLAVAFGLILLLELQDTSLRSEKDIESLLQLPVLAVVPSIRPTSAKKAKELIIRPVSQA